LASASLIGANMAWCRLLDANLEGTDFSHADLHLAFLAGARMNTTKIDHANFDGAIMPDGSVRQGPVHPIC
jgi:uncharacterized protein YjbI with pentapeptide repeats